MSVEIGPIYPIYEQIEKKRDDPFMLRKRIANGETNIELLKHLNISDNEYLYDKISKAVDQDILIRKKDSLYLESNSNIIYKYSYLVIYFLRD